HHPVLVDGATVARGDGLGVGGGGVVVAHRHRQSRAVGGGEGVEDLVEQLVAAGGAFLRGVPGVDDGVDRRQGREAGQQALQGGGGVDAVVVAGRRVGVQVGVAQMQD